MLASEASTVASVGEPTLTRNGVWMNAGTPRSAQPAVKAASWAGVAGGQLPAAGVADEDLDGPGPGGVGVGQPALGQPALDLDVRADGRRDPGCAHVLPQKVTSSLIVVPQSTGCRRWGSG